MRDRSEGFLRKFIIFNDIPHACFYQPQNLRCGSLEFVFFIEVVPCDFSDHPGQDDHRHYVGEGHKSIGDVPDVPDDVQVRSLDVRTDKEQDDESNPVRKDDPDTEYVFKTLFPVVTPSQEC